MALAFAIYSLIASFALVLQPALLRSPIQGAHPNFQVLYSFKGQRDGGNPSAGPIADAAGNLYGTTYAGGDLSCTNGIYTGCGVIYMVDHFGRESVLYRFTGGPADGRNPQAALMRDAAGNLYGTTSYGGAHLYYGTVFKIDTSGHERVLYSFTGKADGSIPSAALVMDASGNLYGTTDQGGSGPCKDDNGQWIGCGVVFRVDQHGNETVLHSFTGGKDGAHPFLGGGLLDRAGNFYGTASSGGQFGAGVAFKLDRHQNLTVLHPFGASGRDGTSPFGLFLNNNNGQAFFGTTLYGGSEHSYGGTLFEVTGQRGERVLYSFTGRGDGLSPDSLVADDAGNLFGTTVGNANINCSVCAGTVFELDSHGKFTLLHAFIGGREGAYPQGAIARDRAGALYGATIFGGGGGCLGMGCGTVFKVTP